MPTILLIYGFRFFFYSKEESRMHVHVEYQGRKVKIWLDTFEVASNDGFLEYQLSKIIKLVRIYEKELKEAWVAHFS